MTTSHPGPAAGPHRQHASHARRDGMRWRRTVARIVPVLCLAACHDGTAPRAGVASMRPYPGFVQVAQAGEAAAWRFDPAHVAQADGQYTIHVIRTLASATSAAPDYVAFDVITDCRHGARRLSGTRYRDDGTAGALVPGDAAPQQVTDTSASAQLLARACPAMVGNAAAAGTDSAAAVDHAAVDDNAAAAAAPSAATPASGTEPGLVRGTFSAPAALELLYGTYDVNTESAAWLTPAIPATLPARDGLHDTPGDPLIVRSLAVIDFTERGHAKKLFVTSGMPVSGGCDACTGLLGLAVFARTDAGWQVESNAPYVASLGAEGVVAKRVAWTGSEARGFALVIEENMAASHMGAAPRVVFARRDGRFVRVDADAGNVAATPAPTLATATAAMAATTATAAGGDGPPAERGAAPPPPAAHTAAAVRTPPQVGVATATAAALGIAAVATRLHAPPRKPGRREPGDAALRQHAGPHREPAAARVHDVASGPPAEKTSRNGVPVHPPPHHVPHAAVRP